MKIAMYNLTTTCRYGGVESFVWEISRELAARGNDIHIVGGRGNISRNLPGVSLRLYPFWPREKVPDFGRRFRKLIERWSMGVLALSALCKGNYDGIHIHKPFDLAVGWTVKKRKGTKLILGSHGTDFVAGDRFFARAVDASVSCSAYNSDLIFKRYGIKPHIIYNGIDPRVFRPLSTPDPDIRRRYCLSDDDKVIVYVGRLIGLKGVKVLLKAIDAIARRQNGVKLLIIGDGEEKGSLAGLAEAMGIANRVFFAGFIPNSELPRYYSVAKIGVFPTLADEAFGISICEAMACGVPVVATRVGGIPEVVDDGVSGFLVPPGKEEELAERIETLLDDDLLGKRMGALAVEAIHERFTWEKVADRLTRVYRTVFA